MALHNRQTRIVRRLFGPDDSKFPWGDTPMRSLLLVLMLSTAATAADPPKFLTLTQAATKAKAESKRLLVVISTPNCIYCDMLKIELDKMQQDSLLQDIVIGAHTSNNDDLWRNRKYPVMHLYSKARKHLKKIEGFHKRPKLLTLLREKNER